MGKAREVLARKRNSPLNVILRAVAVPRGSLPEQRGPKDLSCSTCGTLTCTAPSAHRTPAPNRTPAPAAHCTPHLRRTAGAVQVGAGSGRCGPTPLQVGASMPTKILIVDDAPVVLDFLDFVFRQEGFEVARAVGGYQALDLAGSDPPEIALVDVNMPGIDGLEVCRRMRTDPRTSRIPILLYSATVGEEIEAQARAAGADGFLGKSLHHVELVARVREWLTAASRPGGVGPGPLVDLALDLIGLLQSELVWLLGAREAKFENLAIACERGEQEARRFLSEVGAGPYEAGVGSALGEGISAGRPRLDWPLAAVARFPGGRLLAEAAERIGARALSLAPLASPAGSPDLMLFTSPTTLSLDRRGASAVAISIRHASMGLALWREGGLGYSKRAS